MRNFDDASGTIWQAALLEGSYGNILIVFSPARGDGVRQYALDAANRAEAEQRFAALDDDGLRALLVDAGPWDPGMGIA